jgi:predicted RNase H-like HicB family nuclease/predicted RNA binding protein YcfA (HicA-like mRNA interferase family)
MIAVGIVLTVLVSVGIIPTMNSRDLVRALKDAGWYEDRVAGSHPHFQARNETRSSIGAPPEKGLRNRFGREDTQAGRFKMKFTIAIEAGTKKTAFGVVVPDLPGCFSAGDTVEEAFDNAREAIKVHCEILAEEKKDLPVAKAMSEWQADEAYKGWTWGIVDVEVERFFGPAEKINITVPALTLRRIDAYVASHHVDSRSAFLVKAAEETMRRETAEAAAA